MTEREQEIEAKAARIAIVACLLSMDAAVNAPAKKQETTWDDWLADAEGLLAAARQRAIGGLTD